MPWVKIQNPASDEEEIQLDEKQATQKILEAVLDEEDIGEVLTEGIMDTPIMEEGLTKEVLSDTLRAGTLKDAMLPEGSRLRASTLNAVENEVIRRLDADETDETDMVKNAKDIVLAGIDKGTVQKAKKSVIEALSEGEKDKKKLQGAALQVVNPEQVAALTDAIVQDKQVQDSTYIAVSEQKKASVAQEEEEDIISVTGVDGFIVGPYDLSGSLGTPGNFNNPDFIKAMIKIKNIADEVKAVGGVHIIEPDTEQISERINEGYRFIAYSLDIRMLDYSCRNALSIIGKSKQ